MSRALLALLAAVLLAGCSGGSDEPPPVTAPSSPQDSRLAMPVPTTPVVPDKGTEAENAAAFARYFLTEEVPYLVNSGFTTHYRRTTSPGCEGCRTLLAKVEGYYAEGTAELRKPRVRLLRVQQLDDPFPAAEIYDVALRARFPSLVISPESEEPTRLKGAPMVHILQVVAERGAWSVHEWLVPRPKDDGSTLV